MQMTPQFSKYFKEIGRDHRMITYVPLQGFQVLCNANLLVDSVGVDIATNNIIVVDDADNGQRTAPDHITFQVYKVEISLVKSFPPVDG